MVFVASGPSPQLVTLSLTKTGAFWMKSLNCATPIGPKALSCRQSSQIGLPSIDLISMLREGGSVACLVTNMLLKSTYQRSSLARSFMIFAMYSQAASSYELPKHSTIENLSTYSMLRLINFLRCFLPLKNFYLSLILNMVVSAECSESLDPDSSDSTDQTDSTSSDLEVECC